MSTSPRQNNDSSAASPRRWGLVGRLMRVLALVYLGAMLMLLLFERSLIFPAPKYPQGEWEPSGLEYEDVYFQSADGTKLHGWYVEHPEPQAYILFCHGNGENVSYLDLLLKRYRTKFQASVFAFDYRGYGRSEGKPDEAGVLSDGRAAQEWLSERAGVPPEQIVLVGRSLGGAVAVDLAANNGARGLVLERTFTSLPDVAACIYPCFPVRRLMRTRLDSASKIGKYSGPLLQSHGTEDRIVPYHIGQELFELAPSEDKTFFTEDGRGHNEDYSRDYLLALQHFIANLPQ